MPLPLSRTTILNDGRERAPLYPDGAALLRVIEGVFYKVADGFRQPVAVAGQKAICPRTEEMLVLLDGTVGEPALQHSHHITDGLRIFFHRDGPGVQSGDLQQILHQRGDPIQFLLGKQGVFV